MENEYGSYGLQTGYCDPDYKNFLRDLARAHLGFDVVLYTTDGNADSYVNCGKTEDVYATVDFGPSKPLFGCSCWAMVERMPMNRKFIGKHP